MSFYSIVDKLDEKKQKTQTRKIDIEASYILVENCYKFLQMNNLQEVEGLKKHMKQVLKDLKDIK